MLLVLLAQDGPLVLRAQGRVTSMIDSCQSGNWSMVFQPGSLS
jgi:hypothetical protein